MWSKPTFNALFWVPAAGIVLYSISGVWLLTLLCWSWHEVRVAWAAIGLLLLACLLGGIAAVAALVGFALGAESTQHRVWRWLVAGVVAIVFAALSPIAVIVCALLLVALPLCITPVFWLSGLLSACCRRDHASQHDEPPIDQATQKTDDGDDPAANAYKVCAGHIFCDLLIVFHGIRTKTTTEAACQICA